MYHGVSNQGTGSIGASKQDNKNTVESYRDYALVFTPLDSDYTKILTASSLNFDNSKASKIAVPNNYESYFSSGVYTQIDGLVSDNQALDISEAFNFKVGYSRIDGEKRIDTNIYLDYVHSYLDALIISYTDGDYSFTIKVN